MVIVKKKIIYLCEHPFTEHHTFKMELNILKKNNINIVINDLSHVLFGKKYSKSWKTKIEKKTIKFYSLISWIIFFFRSKNKNVIFWNNIKAYNFSSFIIVLILRIFTSKIIENNFFDIYSVDGKKNFKFIIKRLLYHKLNFIPYLFFFKKKFINFLLNLIPYENVIFLSNNEKSKTTIGSAKNITHIDFNSYDYSNFILFKKKKYFPKKKFAIYTDSGGPYFSGDRHLNNSKKLVCDYDKYYNALNKFFKKLEIFFNIEILIIPHPKYKLKKNFSLNPYFDKKKILNNYDALARISSKCMFFINFNSTAQSFAIASKKPTILFYSSKHIIDSPGNISSQKKLSSKIKIKPIDICNFDMKEIQRCLKVDLKACNDYKYNFLTPRNKSIENKTNSEILANIVERF